MRPSDRLSWSMLDPPESAVLPWPPALQRHRQVDEGQCDSVCSRWTLWLLIGWKHSPEHRQHRAAAGRRSILCSGVSSGEPEQKWRSDAAEAKRGRAVRADEATWFLAGPQSSHQPLLLLTDSSAPAAVCFHGLDFKLTADPTNVLP